MTTQKSEKKIAAAQPAAVHERGNDMLHDGDMRDAAFLPGDTPLESIDDRPGKAEQNALRVTLLRRLRLDGFGGWLFIFYLCVLADLIIWIYGVPTFVRGNSGWASPLLFALYGLTRLWLLLAAVWLLRRRPGADTGVRLSLSVRLACALLLLIFAGMAEDGSTTMLRNCALLSMGHDVLWWLYFRFSRRVHTVLELRERPQLSAVPGAHCPPYTREADAAASATACDDAAAAARDPLDDLPAFAGAFDDIPAGSPAPGEIRGGDSAANAPAGPEAAAHAIGSVPDGAAASSCGEESALFAASTQSASAPAEALGNFPFITKAFMGAALLVLFWQSWNSALGVQQLIYSLFSVQSAALMQTLRTWQGISSIAMLCLSPVAAMAGYCAVSAVIMRSPNGRGLALRLVGFRLLYWLLSAYLVGADNSQSGGTAQDWFFLLLTTLGLDIALFIYLRRGRSLREIFPIVPTTRRLAAFCSRQVSGPGEVSRRMAATACAERTALSGVQGWLLLFCGISAYMAVFFLSVAATVNVLPAITVSVALLLCALLRLTGVLLMVLRPQRAAAFIKGALSFSSCLIIGISIFCTVLGMRLVAVDSITLICFILPYVLPLLAEALGWLAYFSTSRRVWFTLRELSGERPSGLNGENGGCPAGAE